MLDFEYVRAGLYRTYFYINGYRYKITKDKYASTPIWEAYYQWDQWKDKERWKIIGLDFRTKKEAVAACQRHNENPRIRYKRTGKLNLQQITKYSYTKYGFYIYEQVDKDGNVRSWGRKEYVNPLRVGGPDLNDRNDQWAKEARNIVSEKMRKGLVIDYPQEIFEEFKKKAQAYEDSLIIQKINQEWDEFADD